MEVYSDTKFGVSAVFMRFRHVNCVIFGCKAVGYMKWFLGLLRISQ
jgi:hypothetical protein